MPDMKTLTVGGKTYDIVDDGAVRFDSAQSMTAAEQALARANIGAASIDDVNNAGGGSSATGAVRYDETQTLTDTQKNQARNNISAAPASHVQDSVRHIAASERTNWTNHISNANVHVTSDEKSTLSNAKTHMNNTTVHITSTERSNWNAARGHIEDADRHVAYSTTAPVMDGTASVGSASTVARSDHKHPTDTSRASKSEFDAHVGDSTHITEAERNTLNSAKTHIGNGNIHVTEAEKTVWGNQPERITNHVTNNNVHVTADEKTVLSNVQTHMNNTTLHVLSTERDKWNAASTHANAAHNYVRYDASQSLTDVQKAQARSNIGVEDMMIVHIDQFLEGGGGASHDARDIYEHVDRGGTARLDYYGQLLALERVSFGIEGEDVYGYAIFTEIGLDEPYVTKIAIDANGNVEYYEDWYLTNSQAYGGYIPMSVVPASVGQTVAVDYVDDIGRTIWKPVDLPSGGGGGVSTLIVTFGQDLTQPSYLPEDIYNHVQNGGFAVLCAPGGDRYYSLTSCTSSDATFTWIGLEEDLLEQYVIYEDGSVDFFEDAYVTWTGLEIHTLPEIVHVDLENLTADLDSMTIYGYISEGKTVLAADDYTLYTLEHVDSDIGSAVFKKTDLNNNVMQTITVWDDHSVEVHEYPLNYPIMVQFTAIHQDDSAVIRCDTHSADDIRWYLENGMAVFASVFIGRQSAMLSESCQRQLLCWQLLDRSRVDA